MVREPLVIINRYVRFFVLAAGAVAFTWTHSPVLP